VALIASPSELQSAGILAIRVTAGKRSRLIPGFVWRIRTQVNKRGEIELQSAAWEMQIWNCQQQPDVNVAD